MFSMTEDFLNHNDYELPTLPKFNMGIYRSETIGKLAEALSNAQLEFSTIVRDKNNPFFKSKYAPLENVIAATKAGLSSNGLAVTQNISYHPENGELCVITTLMHSSGEYQVGYMPLPKSAKPQDLGSAITYYRRYALCAMLNVSADDDDDGNAANSTDSSPKKASVVDERPQRLEQTRALHNRLVKTQNFEESFILDATSPMEEIAATYKRYKSLLQNPPTPEPEVVDEGVEEPAPKTRSRKKKVEQVEDDNSDPVPNDYNMNHL